MKTDKAPSVGEQHCKSSKSGGQIVVECNHCDWIGTYKDETVAKRMASNHIVKLHREIAKPAPPHRSKKRIKAEAAKPERHVAEVAFCPCCGLNLKAVRVAMSLS